MTAIRWCSGAAQAGAETAGQAAAEYDVAKLLEQLPEPYRRVVVLFYLEDRSCEEVGELLSMPTGTVKALLHRGRKKLAALAGESEMRVMTNKLDIEARLDRSLRKQVAAPRLDGRFDAAVWARIAAEEQRATQPAAGARSAAASGSARWLFVINVIGIAVAALLVVLLRAAGILWCERESCDLPVPQISPTTMKAVVAVSVQSVTLAAVIFGLMFTPLGRRVRSIFT